MTFRAGMKVVCVDDEFLAHRSYGETTPRKGAVYTIRGMLVIEGAQLLHLEEIRNPVIDYNLVTIEIGFSDSRFRPLTDTKSETSFTQGAPKDSERWDNRRKVTIRERAWGSSAELSLGMNCSVSMTAFCDLCFTNSPHKAGDNSMTDLAGLVERLEKATGPDRELDCMIYAQVHGWSYPLRGAAFIERNEAMKEGNAVHYTSSIDAAMTLVPEGFNWASAPHFDDREFSVYRPYDGTADHYFDAVAKTPAIALCIAALKARSPQP